MSFWGKLQRSFYVVCLCALAGSACGSRYDKSNDSTSLTNSDADDASTDNSNTNNNGDTNDHCGDAFRDSDEVCDGDDLGGSTCATLGFTGGTLTCSSNCQDFNKEQCTGEACNDAIDNDGDSAVDCADTDCSAFCANACANPTAINSDGSFNGDTSLRGNSVDGSCQGVGGYDVAYAVTAPNDGTLSLSVASAADLGIFVRDACGIGGTELRCVDGSGRDSNEHLSMAVLANHTYYVFVGGYNAASVGQFTLSVQFSNDLPELACSDNNDNDNDGDSDCADSDCNNDSHCLPGCGNNVREGNEQCDDGNVSNGDGCDATCLIEVVCGDTVVAGLEECDDGNLSSGDGCTAACRFDLRETEPNNDYASGNIYDDSAPWIGRVLGIDDSDFFAVTLTAQSSTLQATVHAPLNPAACNFDSTLSVFGTDGTTLLIRDDDSGVGYCSSATVSGLAPGTYFVRVNTYRTTAFTYQLDIAIKPDICGDGALTGSEQCDDGNLDALDGCSPLCQIEVICGDAVVGAGEQCDDGNLDDGDGCAANCFYELDEIEPNNVVADANVYVDQPNHPWRSYISAGDVDIFAVTVTGPSAILHVETRDDGDGACAAFRLDTIVAILDASGTEIARDDDTGAGYCSLAAKPQLLPGTYYVKVNARDTTASFLYNLLITVEPDVCGDGTPSGFEQCDDGNLALGDGCSDQCAIELLESEPNNTLPDADDFLSGSTWYAQLTPAGDQDFVSFHVASNDTKVTIEIRDLGDNACANYVIDTEIEVQDAAGRRIGYDDNNGAGNCSKIALDRVAAGDYVVRINSRSLTATFLYVLSIEQIELRCGNGGVSGSEECDDGNNISGDGCSMDCRREYTESEPNNSASTANSYVSPFRAQIAPTSDRDYVSVVVPPGMSTIIATVTDDTPGDCANMVIDTLLDLYDTNGTTSLARDDDSGSGYCSMITQRNLAAGTYYLTVSAYSSFRTFGYSLDIRVE